MASKKNKPAPREDDSVNVFAHDDDEDAAAPKSPAERAADDEDDNYFPAIDDEDDAPPPKPKPKPEPAGRAVRTVSLGPPPVRKKGKAKKAQLEVMSVAQRGKARDRFFASQAEQARKKFGHEGVYLGSEAENLIIGVPTPALAYEYVTGQDCFTLGVVIQIVAKHGVGKSALLAEFGRWFDLADGGMVLCENETKFNPHWYSSIQGPVVYSRMRLHRCKSVEDWQRNLTWSIKQMKTDMEGTKDAPGPGRTFPVLFGVDSIMGKMSEENQEKIIGKVGKKGKLGTTGDGFAQARSFPIEAGSITKYMRTVPQLMDRWPFALVLINHLRIKTDDQGNPERNKTGGEQVNFQESFELELKKIGGHAKRIQSANFEGVTLQLSCEKNSFGPTGRKAQTRLLWWHEPDADGNPTQKTVWDWDWATVHLLNTILHGEGQSTYLKNRLKAADFHLDCPSSSDVENSAWSKTLGMTKADAREWTDVGAMIREDRALMGRLRDALGIVRRPRLRGDYLEQIQGIAEGMP